MTSFDAEYREIVRALPRPGWQECLRFVWHVGEAHSWYKHLPCEIEVPFIFYLDPQAGMQLVLTPTGERAFVDITDESTRFHYTWQTTQQYRARFGHWAYYGPYGRSFLFRGEGGTVTTERRATILTEEGTWLAVSDSLQQCGTAMINAFIHTSRLNRPFFKFHVWDKRRDEDALVQQLHDWSAEAESALGEFHGRLSDELAVAVRRRCDASLSQSSEYHSWFWSERNVDNWLAALSAAGASTSSVPALFAGLQAGLTERIRSSKEEGSIANSACAAIVTVRLHQLWTMWLATQRFCQSVYDEPM